MSARADRAGLAALLSSTELHAGLIAALHGDGWQVHLCCGAADVCGIAMRDVLDVVVVDVICGARPWERLDTLLDRTDVPVVALVRGTPEANSALRRGAAMALSEPFDPETLVLAIRAFLRRRPLRSVLGHSVTLGDLTVQVADHTVGRNGRRRPLSPTEWQLLSLFMAHPGYTFSRHELVRGLWGVDIPGREPSVDLCVFRLRRKLENDVRRPTIIETVRNSGYRLSAPVRSADVGARPAPRDAGPGGGLDPVVVSDPEDWLDLYEELADSLAEAAAAARTLSVRASPAVRRILIQTDVAHLDAMVQHCRSRAAYWNRRPSVRASVDTSQNGPDAIQRRQHHG